LNNACPSRITAAAGTRLAGATSVKTSSSFLLLEFYDQVFVFSLQNHPYGFAGSGFPPLSNIPHCSLKKVRALSQSQCGRSSAKIG